MCYRRDHCWWSKREGEQPKKLVLCHLRVDQGERIILLKNKLNKEDISRINTSAE